MKLFAFLMILLSAAPATGANSPRNFGGIGIDGVPWADGRIVVKQLVTGGPAHLAGIKAGDIITHIDGKPTEGSDFRDMIDHRLRGRSGTPVTITIHRPGSGKPLTFKLIRRQMVLPANR
jgi:C-terminal processing protease CtpA/Prc